MRRQRCCVKPVSGDAGFDPQTIGRAPKQANKLGSPTTPGSGGGSETVASSLFTQVARGQPVKTVLLSVKVCGSYDGLVQCSTSGNAAGAWRVAGKTSEEVSGTGGR